MSEAAECRWRLTVETGPHAGASIPIELELTNFGKAIDNHIVAADDALTDREAVFLLTKGELAVRPLGAALTVNGCRIAAGKTMRLRRGHAITAGETRLRVERAAPSDLPRGLRLGLCAGGLLAVLGLVAAVPRADSPKPQSVQAALAPSSDDPAAGSPRIMLAALSRRLQATGLAGRIGLRASGAAVFATGAIPGADLPRWRHLVRWFDHQAQGQTMLIDRTETASAILSPIAVAAVSYGGTPFLVSQSGQRYTLGAMVPGGWILQRVAAHHVVLRHGAKTLRVNF